MFRHILSKLNVTFAKSSTLDNATVKINTVTISGLDDSGDYEESDYDATATPKVSGWTSSSVDATYALNYNAAGGQVLNASTANKPYFFIESLVMPQEIADNQVTLTAKYTITSGSYSENYTYKLDLYDVAALQKFYDGYNYTLNFTIDPDVIKFDATVSTWDNQAAINQTID